MRQLATPTPGVTDSVTKPTPGVTDSVTKHSESEKLKDDRQRGFVVLLKRSSVGINLPLETNSVTFLRNSA